MNTLGSVLLAAAMAQTGLAANLAISTYLKSGFTPAAIASDSQGNIYLAGSAVIDPASQSMGAMVAKLDPNATQFCIWLTLTAPPTTRCRGWRWMARAMRTLPGGPPTRTFRW